MNQEELEQIMSHPMFPMTRQAFMDSRNRLDYLSYVHKQKFMPETSKCSKCPFGSTLKEYEEDDILAGEQHEEITK